MEELESDISDKAEISIEQILFGEFREKSCPIT